MVSARIPTITPNESRVGIKLAERAFEHEAQGAQAEQCEGVGGEDQEWVAGDAVHRGHRVHREHDISGQDRPWGTRTRSVSPAGMVGS